MSLSKTTVERAFELARSGMCRTVDEIRKRLRAEGYPGIDEHLRSRSLTRQLSGLIRGSREAARGAR